MSRIPLRPLARILDARSKGENPDAIERENIRQRHEEMQDRARARAEGRLLVLGVFFFCAFSVVGARMGLLATSEAQEPLASATGANIATQRADIVDREGRILATNFETHSLYAQPPLMVDPIAAAEGLMQVFPDLDKERLIKDFTGKRKFIWIKKRISPEQKQAVHDIGDPGLLFGPREMRLYPNGMLAAHVLGGAGFGKEGVNAAEVIGVAGVEKQFDGYLRDPANGAKPLQLSLDLTVQAATERVLLGGMKIMNAKGASSVLMDVHTGEVISVASLPAFDPNDRPRPPTSGFDPSDSPLFNRAVQGVYELGSVYKIFTAAQAVDLGLVNSETIIDTSGPMRVGGFPIGEFRNKNYGKLSVADIIVKSSNRGTGRLAMQIGVKRQKDFLNSLGMFDPTPFEIVEAKGGQPLLPKQWGELSTVTISYGHGLSTSPMHLAAGYAAIANGGHYVSPTVLRQKGPQYGPRVMSPTAARQARKMLRKVVTSGTASFGEVPGYAVGGKTGTADKPKPRGGYYEDKVIATFATLFPANDPKYVLVVTLDEPSILAYGEKRRTAGWTAVPVAAEMIGRVAPLLGLRPQVEPGETAGITLTSN
ncbi:peptidoglycan D,D-transpeptidase FtsI family protein [Falsiruegeria mediterranea]|uniref:Putative peptidoglycan D,D-transpeptidase FtsI n=1 Tax=Falsiruegeria mediterranea M17 TaxID=1200281 RepID=A0A2R8C4R1_9RHOB|nr:penicillin-binding protein 2 [Falsiruegeria mediterranea]SPJ27397.1 putative peptidoglycan D,D-transpeptidase FtsI [Falsiruegeria mediterranea M17]